ncbi:serine threonine kinase [Brazilian porcupinepox virus 1]|nr:serine threonine kinase [Brazilian porcupinepox virus 1]
MNDNLLGDIIIDKSNTNWKIGDILGKGGFGYIYTISKDDNNDKNKYVIKVEPKSNGPLFVEQVFYQRICKKSMIDEWKKNNNVLHLGIPLCHGFGFYKKNNIDYRFIIIDRLGCDLETILIHNNNKLPKKSVYLIVISILNVLNYMHDNGYTHGDIKSSNIAVGFNNKNNIYLFDFGLSYRFIVNGKHAKYKSNPNKMHNGTLEFTSVDMHRGVTPSRRSDLEILGYCIIKWLGGVLPWNKLKNRNRTMESKEKYLSSISSLLSISLGKDYPKEILKYFNYVTSLKYEDSPDYNFIKNIFL